MMAMIFTMKEVFEMKIGDVITMAGIEWKAFKKDKNGIYVFATSSIDDSRFSDQTNNYRYSLIRSSLLNGELLYNLKGRWGISWFQ